MLVRRPAPCQHRRRHSRPLQFAAMLSTVRAMPGGIRLFLLYALLILAAIGVALPRIVELAVAVPVSFEGLVAMILLAYTIFTTTLVLQRKQAARGLALGLATLTLPLVVFCLTAGLIPQTIFLAALAALLFRGLLRGEVRPCLNAEYLQPDPRPTPR